MWAKMKNQIAVKTALDGRHVRVWGHWNIEPGNFMIATRVAQEVILENPPALGYRTWIELDGQEFGSIGVWPSTAEQVQAALNGIFYGKKEKSD